MTTVLVPQRFTYTKDGLKRLALAIQATLLHNKWSNRELAKRASLAHGTINRYTKATGQPTDDGIKSIAPYIYKVVTIGDDCVEIDTETTYEANWTNLAKLATDEFYRQPFYNLDNMEILKKLIINEIQLLGMTHEEFAKLVTLSPSVLKEILKGNIPGNKENKLSLLAPRLTNPLTQRKFTGAEELAQYCGLIKNPTHLERDFNSNSHLINEI